MRKEDTLGIYKPIVILNAPPNGGKDMLADYILSLPRYKRWERMMFKTELYELTAQYYGIRLEIFMKLATSRAFKDMPSKRLGGITPRQGLIHVSEDEIKPTFGDEYFGVRAANRINESHQKAGFLFTDGGFNDEVNPLEMLNGHKVFVVRIVREGCDFGMDSRTYLKNPDYTLVNSTKGSAFKQMDSIMSNILMKCHGV